MYVKEMHAKMYTLGEINVEAHLNFHVEPEKKHR